MTTSLDGHIEDLKGSIGFTTPSDELHRHFNQRELEIDTHLYGRRLYETMVPYWVDALTDPNIDDAGKEYAEYWRQAETVVFSRTLDEVHPSCRLVSTDPVEEVRRLKQLPGKDMDVGGATLAAALMAADLIDEYRLYIAPVVIGGGKPFFTPGIAVNGLSLTDIRKFDNGTVMLRYDR